MKCVRNPATNEIKRVTETEAKRLASYGWQYITKGEYKRHVRPKPWEARPKAAQIVAEMPKAGFVSGLADDGWKR